MKTIIILGALVISTGAFAQGVTEVKKEIGTSQTELRQKAEKGEKVVKEKVSQGKDRVNEGKEQADKVKGKGNDMKEEAEDKLNNGNAFGKDKEGKTGKEFGQHRAAEAKLKATQVKTKADADAVIRMSKEDTKETVGSIDEKMLAARTKLTEKLASGEMTQVQYDEKLKQLMDFEKRKNAIITEMK